MSRVATLMVLVFSLVCLAAHQAGHPAFGDQPVPVNSTIAHFFLSEWRSVPIESEFLPGSDSSVSAPRILLLNYSTYDSAYANKMHQLIQRQMPASSLTDFWDGSSDDLTSAIVGQDIVVVAYPSSGNAAVIKSYGKVLAQYVRQGGAVVITGTHEYGMLQQYGLFDLDFGYFCADPEIHHSSTSKTGTNDSETRESATSSPHPVLVGTTTAFNLRNYAYPLDISDPNFVTLADVRGYPVMGYKLSGAGKIVYLGLEYYYDEAEPNQILTNTLQWLTPVKVQPSPPTAPDISTSRFVKQRREEVLFAGSGTHKNEVFDLRIYPNPYVSKATLDIDLNRATTVSVEMTNETGQIVAVVLPRKNLVPGMYRLELPNLLPGVYFVQCRSGEKTTVKKVVKMSSE